MRSPWVSVPQLHTLLGDLPLTSPIYADLTRRIRLLVVDGRLSAGIRMPSERDLAAGLHLSRSTVATAYEELRKSGYLTARQGAGNFVTLPARAGGALPGPPPGVWDGSGDTISLSYASAAAPPELAEVFRRAAEQLPSVLAGNGYYPDGLVLLRARLAEWFCGRGLPTEPDQLVVTAGALSALNIVARTVLSPGDRVLLESPSYPNAIRVLGQQARPVPCPLPVTGWDAAEMDLVLRQAAPRMSYLIPDFQNPTGQWMSEEARPEVAAALARSGSLTVIDESLVEVALTSQPPRTPLGAYLPDSVTIGSASKAYWGGLRIGWIRAPRQLVRPLVETRALLDLGAAAYEQLVLAELLANGAPLLDAHRDRLRAGRDQLCREVSGALPEWKVTRPDGGLSLWATLPGEDSSRLAGRADRFGLELTAGPRFFVAGGGERHLRLPYTAAPAVLSEAVRRLAELQVDVSASGRGRIPATLGLTA